MDVIWCHPKQLWYYTFWSVYMYIYMRTCTVCTRTDINMVTVLPIEITSGLQLQPLLLCLERKRRRHPNQPTFEHFASISYISYTCMSYIYTVYSYNYVYNVYIYIVHKHGSLARHPQVGFGNHAAYSAAWLVSRFAQILLTTIEQWYKIYKTLRAR